MHRPFEQRLTAVADLERALHRPLDRRGVGYPGNDFAFAGVVLADPREREALVVGEGLPNRSFDGTRRGRVDQAPLDPPDHSVERADFDSIGDGFGDRSGPLRVLDRGDHLREEGTRRFVVDPVDERRRLGAATLDGVDQPRHVRDGTRVDDDRVERLVLEAIDRRGGGLRDDDVDGSVRERSGNRRPRRRVPADAEYAMSIHNPDIRPAAVVGSADRSVLVERRVPP